MRPTATVDGSLNDARRRAAGVNDLTAADIDPDMPFVPNGKPWNFGDGVVDCLSDRME